MLPILFQFKLPFNIPVIGGHITIYTYGFLTALGILCGYFLSYYRVKKKGYDVNIVSDIIFYSVIFGYIFARLLYVIINWDVYRDNLTSIIKIWEGGIVFYGGIIAAVITALVYFKIKKLNVFKFADLMVPAIPLGHSFGRIGCLMYGCCFGRLCKKGISFPKWENMNGAPAYLQHLHAGFLNQNAAKSLPVYPTQIISSAFLLCLTLFLLFYDKKLKEKDGETFFAYLMLYPAFRFIIEFYRYYEEEFYLFKNITVSQIISIILFLIGICFFIYIKIKKSSSSET